MAHVEAWPIRGPIVSFGGVPRAKGGSRDLGGAGEQQANDGGLATPRPLGRGVRLCVGYSLMTRQRGRSRWRGRRSSQRQEPERLGSDKPIRTKAHRVRHRWFSRRRLRRLRLGYGQRGRVPRHPTSWTCFAQRDIENNSTLAAPSCLGSFLAMDKMWGTQCGTVVLVR